MEQNPLVSRPLPVLFGQFVGPAMVAMVLDGIQGMVDGLFLGRYAGPDAMASVNIANPFFQIIIGSTMILCTGTMSAAGRALGAQDYSRAKNLYRSALAVLLALSGTILLAGVLFARPIARFLGANEVLLPGAARYVQVIACFAPVRIFGAAGGPAPAVSGRHHHHPVHQRPAGLGGGGAAGAGGHRRRHRHRPGLSGRDAGGRAAPVPPVQPSQRL